MPTALKRDVLLLLCYFTYRGVHVLDNEAVKELLPRSFHPPKKHHSLLRFIARFVAPGVEEKEKAGRGGARGRIAADRSKAFSCGGSQKEEGG